MFDRQSATRRRRGRSAALLCLLAAALVLAGCPPFDPRDPPKPPQPGRCDGNLSQRTPAELRIKIERAFECALFRPDYEDCLAPTFIYDPDTDAESLDPAFWSGWTKAREVAVMEAALQTTPPTPREVRVRFFRFRDTGELSGDRARFDVQYEFTLLFDGLPPQLQYGGCARWDLVGITTLDVKLERWEDVAGFGLGTCMADSATTAGTKTSGFLRFERR